MAYLLACGTANVSVAPHGLINQVHSSALLSYEHTSFARAGWTESEHAEIRRLQSSVIHREGPRGAEII